VRELLRISGKFLVIWIGPHRVKFYNLYFVVFDGSYSMLEMFIILLVSVVFKMRTKV